MHVYYIYGTSALEKRIVYGIGVRYRYTQVREVCKFQLVKFVQRSFSGGKAKSDAENIASEKKKQ